LLHIALQLLMIYRLFSEERLWNRAWRIINDKGNSATQLAFAPYFTGIDKVEKATVLPPFRDRHEILSIYSR